MNSGYIAATRQSGDPLHSAKYARLHKQRAPNGTEASIPMLSHTCTRKNKEVE